MRASGGRFGQIPAFCASLLVLWILIIDSSHGQQDVGGRRRLQRRGGGGSVIRARVSSSGLPIRRLRPVAYDPIFAASEVATGYAYSRPNPIAETTTEISETDAQESPNPSSPVKDFMDILKVMPIAAESDQQIDSESLTPGATINPGRGAAQMVASVSAPSRSHSSNHHGDDSWPDGYKGVIPGEEGVDYPILSAIPDTSFSCGAQQYSGYYADEEARCQVFHVCLRRPTRLTIEKWSFLCPNGTVFSQEDFVCVWWNNAPRCDSDTLANLYQLNAKLGWDNHDETATKSIKNIMESMVQNQRNTMPMFMTTTPLAAPIPQPTQRPAAPTSPVRTNNNRIPVSLTATLGGKDARTMTLTTSVPITTITKNMIITSDGQPITYSTNEEYESQREIDSQVITDIRSQSEARKQTQTGSSTKMSESEAYELLGRPGSISNPPPNPLIVNRGSNQEQDTTYGTTQAPDEDSVSFSDYELQENTNTARPVPTVVMMPVEQTYSDGSKAVVDMPVLMMIRPTTTPSPTQGYAPVAVANPQGVTIPNRPSTPPRTYLPPRRDPQQTTTQAPLPPPTMPPATYLPPRVEQEPIIDYDYEKDKSPMGSRPIVDYEMVESVSALPETTTTTPRPVISNAYLPPRTEAPEVTTSQPETTYAQPEPPTTQREFFTETTTIEPVTEKVIDSVEQEPSGGYLPPSISGGYGSGPAQPQRRPMGGSSTFVAMDGALINQILGSAGVTDSVEDGEKILGYSSQGSQGQTQAQQVQYPTPMSSQVSQDNRPDVGTASQLYNGNVRTLYSKKQPGSMMVGSVEQTTLPVYDKQRNIELLKQIQSGGYEATRTNNLADNLEKLTPGYIDLPLGPGPTQLSPAQLPGTESVQAFLTSQKNIDPKQTLEIFQYGKYALFMPNQQENSSGQVPEGTPAPTGLVKGSSDLPQPTRGTGYASTLFGPLARDVMPEIMTKLRQKEVISGGYGNSVSQQQSSSSGSQPQKPSGLYGPPTKEFQSQSSSQPGSPQPSGGYREGHSLAEIMVQTTVERQPILPQPVPQSQSSSSQSGARSQSQGGYGSSQSQSSSQTGARPQPPQPQGGYGSQSQRPQSQESSSSPQGGYTGTPSTQSSPTQTPQGQNSPPTRAQDPRPFRPSDPDPGLFQPVPSNLSPQAPTPLQFSPQIQLPVLVESHSSHDVPVDAQISQQPLQQLRQQLQQQRSQFQQPQQFGGYQQQQQAPVLPPPPSRPSGLYTTPLFDQFAQQQRIVSPQSTILPNPIQLQNQQQFRMQSTQLPELIQAIPVHSSTYVETRPVGPNFQGPYANNAVPMIPQQAFNNYLPPPPPPPMPQGGGGAFRFSGNPGGYSGSGSGGNNNPQVTQFQQQVQYQQQHQFQYPQFTFQEAAASPLFNTIQTDAGRGSGGGGYGKQNQNPGGYNTGNFQQNLFSSNEPSQQHPHQQFHQQSHQQHIQQFIQNQRIRSVNHQQLQHPPSSRHHQSQQPSRSYGLAGPGAQSQLAGEQQGSYSNKYEVFYPGKDKSKGIKLTYSD